MADKIRIRARQDQGVVEVKALMEHPMETGQRKDKKGNKIPAHFIQTVTAKANGKVVFEAYWGGAISKNPYLAFEYNGKSGDQVELVAVDNQGQTFNGSTKVR
ncbi:MAG: thiosulfate oxidation carrier complex protein SoxZ [bacterium]|nr:thiosulfate oxidation carrier complex protein SoxZ [bacterium]